MHKDFEAEISKQNLNIIGWRDVLNAKVVGSIAAQSQPRIKQVFIGKSSPDQSEEEFNLKLYLARKISENTIYSSPFSQKNFFYFSSLHTRTIIYKGLLIPEDIERFYIDLSNPKLVTSLHWYTKDFQLIHFLHGI